MKKISLLVLFTIFSIILTGCNKSNENDLATLESLTQETTATTPNDITTTNITLGIEGQEPTNIEDTIKTEKKYKEFSQQALQNALKSNKQVLLVFYKKGSQSCEMLHKNIQNNRHNVPESVVLLEMNITKHPEYKTTYHLTNNNTIIYLNKDGKEDFRISRGIIKLSQLIDNL